jgi:hypothetical protein
VAGVPQAPLPLQKAAGVKVVPLQEADPHCTDVDAFWQLPPLQRPVLPQVAVTGQRPCGSGAPLVTAWQVPLPETLQDWQVEQLEAMQQTPSVQWPVPHSWSVAQVAPGEFLGRQLPPAPVQ